MQNASFKKKGGKRSIKGYYFLGKAHYRLGEFDKAYQVIHPIGLDMASSQFPIEFYKFKLRVYKRVGDKKNALRVQEKIKKDYPWEKI